MSRLPKSKPAATVQRLVVDATNRAPLYHQIFMILRSKIMNGEYSAAKYLPGEHELAKMFGVSRITSVRALNELAAHGLVSRERGRGTLVRIIETGTITRGPAEHGSGRDQKRGISRGERKIELVSLELVVPPPDVAHSMVREAATRVRRIVRLERFEGKPYRFVTSYLPPDIGSDWKRGDLKKLNIANLMERSGIVMARIDERLTATLADITMSNRLDVAVGSPLITITRTVFDADGRVIEHVQGYYPSERYEYAVSVTRHGRFLSPLRALNS